MADYPSQWNRLSKDAISDKRMEGLLFCHVHFAVQFFIQIDQQPARKPWRVCGPASISKSRSLSLRASPRARRSQTHARASRRERAAMARIAARFSAPSSLRFIRFHSRTAELGGENSAHRPLVIVVVSLCRKAEEWTRGQRTSAFPAAWRITRGTCEIRWWSKGSGNKNRQKCFRRG